MFSLLYHKRSVGYCFDSMLPSHLNQLNLDDFTYCILLRESGRDRKTAPIYEFKTPKEVSHFEDASDI